MKETVYKTNSAKYFLKSSLTWFCVAVQLGLSLYFLRDFSESGLIATLVVIGVFSFLTVPGLILHFNYLKYSKNAKFVIRYDNVEFIKNNQKTILKSNEIVKIILHQSPTNSRFPWWNYQWFELIDSSGNKICVNYYIMDISDMWINTLSRKINSDKLERKENYFPLIK
jgi:hypothetical protein